MATNMKENGFETMIVKYLVENNHYEEGSNSDYNKIYAIDEVRLFRFLHDTQDEKLAELRIEDNEIEKKKYVTPLENPSEIKVARRDIARMKTELRQRELNK